MTVATELLARLEHRGIAATLDPDGTVLLEAPDPIPPKVEQLVAKYQEPLRGLIAYRHALLGGEPACWCNRCGATVTQYDPDGTAWCTPCLQAHATRTVTEAFPESEIETEVTPNHKQRHSSQLTQTKTKE